jgi:hypothetical protein
MGPGLSAAKWANGGGCLELCAASYWPTEFLVFSDFLVAEPHAHGTLQLSIGIHGSPRVRLDGAWHRACGVLIDTDVAHAFDCDGQLTAIGWIEGESRLAEQLRDRHPNPTAGPAPAPVP